MSRQAPAPTRGPTPSTARRRALLIAAAVAVTQILGAATAAVAIAFTPPAGTPDLSQMVLQPSDFTSPGKVTAQGWAPADGYIGSYDRRYGPSVATDGVPLLMVDSQVSLTGNAAEAAVAFSETGRAFRTRSFDRQLASALLGSGKHTHLTLHGGKVRTLRLGFDALLIPFTLQADGAKISIAIVLLHVDRAVGSIIVLGVPGHPLTTVTVSGLADDVAGHIHTGLLPVSTLAPSIAGSAVQGQTLTATPGTWSNSPEGFSYQWLRCDTTGQNCVAIAGATQQSYTVGVADTGATLAVTVVATDTDGQSQPATSAPTAVVS